MRKLREIRQRQGMRQAELARQLNVSRSSVCIAEKKGIRTTETAKRYAAILDCDWRELLD